MLRTVVQVIGVVLALIGAWLIIAGTGTGWQALIFGLVLFAAVRFERWRIKPSPSGSAHEWQATGERFEDPGTGRTVQVEYNPATGERRYRSDDGSTSLR
jgi:hypothetical protein